MPKNNFEKIILNESTDLFDLWFQLIQLAKLNLVKLKKFQTIQAKTV